MVFVTIVLFLVACGALVASGSWMVKLLIRIASHLRLSEFVVAFIIMAFSTSLPELFVGIDSAINEEPTISLGNSIGSNIADVTLIIGIAALLGRGLRVKNPHIKKDCLMMVAIAVSPIILMVFDKTLSRFDGGILIAIFLFYVHHLFRTRKLLRHAFSDADKNHMAVTCLLFMGSLIVLFLSADFVVKYSIELASEFALPPILIGLFFIALGTSLPELVFESRAVLARKDDLAIGDAMGSVVCNSTLVLGVTALITPITNSFLLFLTSSIAMIIVVLLFTALVRQKKGITVNHAIMLIVVYIVYTLFEFYYKMIIG